MDRRREPRFETGQEAQITLLDEQPATMPARLENLSARGMRLITNQPLPVNSPVRVDLNRSVLLGEVCYVQPLGKGFAIGLVLSEVLHEVPELQPLVAVILGEDKQPAETPTPRPAATRA